MGIRDGKIAIVAGSGRGIGRGEGLELAAQGAQVVINDVGGSAGGKDMALKPSDEYGDEVVEPGRLGGSVDHPEGEATWDPADVVAEVAAPIVHSRHPGLDMGG